MKKGYYTGQIHLVKSHYEFTILTILQGEFDQCSTTLFHLYQKIENGKNRYVEAQSARQACCQPNRARSMQAISKLTAMLPGQNACCKLPATLPGEVACCKLPGQVARQSCMLQVAWSSWQFASCQVKLANCKFSGQVSKLPASWQLQVASSS